MDISQLSPRSSEQRPRNASNTHSTNLSSPQPATHRRRWDTSWSEVGRSDGIYGLEGIGLLLVFTFFIRVIGDIVRRATQGRSLAWTVEREVERVWGKVVDALT
ncbi:hypothetical protein O3P69_020604 [Scylla paramamosain]|uniref:Uncharacterized protein n=1 Tax=Scylla paramamosain TaxID=85552 RepID=A0AAW0TPY2_SCYPA